MWLLRRDFGRRVGIAIPVQLRHFFEKPVWEGHCNRPLIDDDVAAGRLAIAVDPPVPVTSGYWLVKPPGIETRRDIVAATQQVAG